MISKLISKFKKSDVKENSNPKPVEKKEKQKVAPTRIGELGEYKINIQLDQLPKNSKYLSDLLLPNPKSKSGYSQIDHVVLTTHAIFVIETKNYSGTIYGDRKRANWSVNGKFPMMNPFNQNYGHIQSIQSLIKNVDDSNIVSMVSFTKRCTFKVNEELRKIQSNDLIVYDIELSEFITRKLNVLKIQHPTELFTEQDILHMYAELKDKNITNSEVREKHVELSNSKEKNVVKDNFKSSASACNTCGKEVSEKIKSYCLANKQKFKGNVYCYEHQKLEK